MDTAHTQGENQRESCQTKYLTYSLGLKSSTNSIILYNLLFKFESLHLFLHKFDIIVLA